jgi:hypothetical protein
MLDDLIRNYLLELRASTVFAATLFPPNLSSLSSSEISCALLPLVLPVHLPEAGRGGGCGSATFRSHRTPVLLHLSPSH